ncbi:MAG: TonB-dependent receptor plug domain-containing protein, partial [Planctomycetota bacterium]
MALSVLPVVAHAQNTTSLISEEVVISGGFTPVQASEYGRAFSVVTSEQIEQRQIREVSEVLRALPGVSVNRSGGPGGFTQVRIRGSEGNHVLVLIDGVEVSAPQAGEYDFAGLLASDIERVEVLRGPQSALYGSNATAGVISITTKGGERGTFSAGGSFEAGSSGSYQPSAFIRGGGEEFDFSFSATGRHDGGFDVSNDPGGKDDEDDNFTLNSKANIDLTEYLTLGGTFRFTDRESDFDQFNFGAATRDGLVTDANNFVQQREIFGSVNASLDSFGGHVLQGVTLGYTDVATTNFTNALRSSDVESDRLRAAYQATIALDAETLAEANHQLTYRQKDIMELRDETEEDPKELEA